MQVSPENISYENEARRGKVKAQRTVDRRACAGLEAGKKED